MLLKVLEISHRDCSHFLISHRSRMVHLKCLDHKSASVRDYKLKSWLSTIYDVR